ncbi:MAG: hypothetical protein JSS67_01505 [Bacteroidetes bacterium]|nr:hypothetical protein [Bacteroidota bacterium]
MKISPATLTRLEAILSQSQYTPRYERGTFQSGWCLLEKKRVVVLNKFLDVEGRINVLLELIPKLEINYDMLTLESQQLYDSILQLSITEQ